MVGIVVVVLGSVMCCGVYCCRRRNKKTYEVGKDENFKTEFGLDDDEQAAPLPEKLAFDDKQVLIA